MKISQEIQTERYRKLDQWCNLLSGNRDYKHIENIKNMSDDEFEDYYQKIRLEKIQQTEDEIAQNKRVAEERRQIIQIGYAFSPTIGGVLSHIL